MDELLVQSWNLVVRPDDEVWHLGDFALGASPERLKQIFRRLNGRKNLVIGNHDRQAVRDLPWANRGGVQIADKTFGSQRVVMCHYALRTWPGASKGAISLYGHSHGQLMGTSQSLDVGIDCWDYMPASLEQVLERMKGLPPYSYR